MPGNNKRKPIEEVANEEDSLVLYFSEENTFTIVPSKDCKNINELTADVKYDKNYITADVVFRGTRKVCEHKASRGIFQGSYFESEQEEIDAPINEKKTNKILRKSTTIESITSIDIEESEEICSHESPTEIKTEIKKLKTYFASMANALTDIQNNIIELNKNIAKSIDKSESSEIFLDKILYNGKNLIRIPASQFNKYITALMEVLFSEDELAKGYIIEGKSTSERTPLDLDRVKLLKDAVRNKYKISTSDFDEKWNEVKSIANRKCFDTARSKNKASKTKE